MRALPQRFKNPAMRGVFLFLFTLCLIPALGHAGIRVQGTGGEEGIKDSVLIDGTGFGSTPLPGAVSLPAATSLTLEASPPVTPLKTTTIVTAPASTTLTITTSGTNTVVVAPVTPPPPARNLTQIQTCRKSLQLLAETTVAAYTRQPQESYMEVLAAATVLDGQVTAGASGDIQPLKKALAKMPWAGTLRKEIQQAGKLTQTFCMPTGGWPKTVKTD